MTHILLPFMVLPLYSVMKSIPPTTCAPPPRSARRRLSAFRRVYLPQTLPGVSAGCLLVFILALGYYITPALVGGAEDQMISYFIAFYTNQVTELGHGRGARARLLLVAVLVALCACTTALVGHRQTAEWADAMASARPPAAFRRSCCAPSASPCLLFLVAPILAIVPLSFNAEPFLTYPMPGFSLRWYGEFFDSAVWQLALRNSLIVALFATRARDGARHARGARPVAPRLPVRAPRSWPC